MELSEPSYYVLASLQDGPLHGYGILKHVETITEGRIRLAVGTLYGVLDRLVERGFIVLASEEIVEGRARRSYQLTRSGFDTLTEEATHLAAAAAVVRPRAKRGAVATSLA